MPTPPPAPPPAPIAEPSAGETLSAWTDGVAARFARLDPQETLVNVALTVLIVVLAFAAIRMAGVLLRVGWRRIDREWPPTGEAKASCPKAVRMTWGLARIVAVAAAACAVLAVWGLDPLAWFRAGVGAVLLRLALIAVATTAAFEATYGSRLAA